MTDEESKPFEPSLRPFKLDKKRHFEYVTPREAGGKQASSK